MKNEGGQLTPLEAREDVRRVAEAMHEPRWWESMVTDQKDADFVYGLAREAGYEDVKPGWEKQIQGFIEKVNGGLYLRRLETGDIPWSVEQIGRDLWQNFFDANGYTLDNVNCVLSPADKPGMTNVRISADAEFDPRRLLHFGATSKIGDEKAVGQFGVGSKDAAFALLRNHKVDEVTFGTGPWALDFYLDKVPEEEYETAARGLFAKALSFDKKSSGSFVEFTAPAEIAQKIAAARDFFYRSDHPDLQNPDFETPDFLIKFHPKKRGKCYINGQQIPYAAKNDWGPSLPDLTICTKKTIKGLSLSQDRDIVTENELKRMLRVVGENLKPQEAEELLYLFETLWDNKLSYGHEEPAETLLHSAVDKLSKINYRLPDHYDTSKMVAATSTGFDSKNDDLEKFLRERAGIRVVKPFFTTIGVTPSTERIALLQKKIEAKPSPEEAKRMATLQNFMREMLQGTADGTEDLMRFIDNMSTKDLGFMELPPAETPLLAKPIKMYQDAATRGGFHAKENEFLHQEIIRGDFSEALGAYAHEICHLRGDDHSILFGQTLTDVTIRLNRFRDQHPEVYERYRKEWDSVKIKPSVEKTR